MLFYLICPAPFIPSSARTTSGNAPVSPSTASVPLQYYHPLSPFKFLVQYWPAMHENNCYHHIFCHCCTHRMSATRDTMAHKGCFIVVFIGHCIMRSVCRSGKRRRDWWQGEYATCLPFDGALYRGGLWSVHVSVRWTIYFLCSYRLSTVHVPWTEAQVQGQHSVQVQPQSTVAKWFGWHDRAAVR